MVEKTLLMREIERKHGAPLEELITGMVERGESREAMARHFGISYWTLTGWLDRLGAQFTTTVQFSGKRQ